MINFKNATNGYIIGKNYIGKYGMRYGIYAIGNEMEIPNNLTENPYTLRIKINGKDIKDYNVDYMDIMQNAFSFYTKDCINNPMAFRDWMSGLDWGVYMDSGAMYQNILLIFRDWNQVGKALLHSGEKVRDKILADFIKRENNENGILDWFALNYGANDDELKCFNIYLVD